MICRLFVEKLSNFFRSFQKSSTSIPDSASITKSLDPISRLRLPKQKFNSDWYEKKLNNPNLNQTNSKQWCFSDSTIKSYRDDINVNSPYGGINTKKDLPETFCDLNSRRRARKWERKPHCEDVNETGGEKKIPFFSCWTSNWSSFEW